MIEIKCAVCSRGVWRARSHIKHVAKPTCSYQCNGVLRGRELTKHAHKGRAAWTEASLCSYRKKMSGPNNPAWKGGVTYFRKHGNYPPIKYVRCPLPFKRMARNDGYVIEHRLIVARALGRCLLRREVVHHINHDATDNRLKNLELFFDNKAHKSYEHHGVPRPIWRG